MAAMIAACGTAKAIRSDKPAQSEAKTTPRRLIACQLITLEEMSALTGQTYSTAEAEDDPTQSSSKCQYTSPTNPAGVSLDIQWITPSEYSSEAEHLALQHASIAGARLGGKLAEGVVPPGAIGGMPSGAVEGVGDEATASMALLTARKGDVTIMLQIFPADMMKFVTDPKVANALFETEKTVMLKAFSRLP
jgi:hypothetical protein